MSPRVSAGAGKGAERIYSITDFGAVRDEASLSTKQIQAAIDACAANGGGVVVVPKGTFSSGAIFLKRSVNLRLDEGAVLRASTNLADYPMVATRWEGVERDWPAALINADRVDGFELSGAGTVDGAGQPWWKMFWELREAGVDDLVYKARRPRLVCVSNSKDAKISGLHLRDQPVWCVHLLYCENATVEGLTIRAPVRAPSSDGIDVDSCRNVKISRCDIECDDDCISIKSGRDEDGLRVNRPSEKILVEHCRFGAGHGGVAFGSETSGGIRHVEVRDCVVEGGNRAAVRFKSAPCRGGIMEDVVFRDIKLNGVGRAFEMNMTWSDRDKPAAAQLPKVRNVKLINVSGRAESAGLISGLKDSPIEKIKFTDCKVSAKSGLQIKNGVGIDTRGLRLDLPPGSPMAER